MSKRMRLRAVVWLLAVSTVAASISVKAPTPFYQQAKHHNDLVEAQSAPGLRQQLPFLSSQHLYNDETEGAREGGEDENDFDIAVDDDEEGDDDDDDDDIETTRHHRKGWLYLIRHGEKVKNSDKTGLSDRGVQRAKCLTEVFGSRKSSATYPIDYILAQDFKPSGQRRRPYETVKPLAKKHHLPLKHSCDRDDTRCAVHHIKKRTKKGQNVLVVWEHARLSNIAKALGVKGLVYPSDRYDIVFKIRGKKVHSIFSEGCQGLDDQWVDWQPQRRGKHGKAPHGGRLIDDESWADKE